MSKTNEKTAISSRCSGFWVVGEIAPDGRLRKVTLELLNEAKKLADRRGQLSVCVLLSPDLPDGFEAEIRKAGCSHILLLDCGTREFDVSVFTEALIEAIEAKNPEVVLLPATVQGRELAPRVACRLRTGLTADCTDLDLDGAGNLVQIRPTFGGNILASILTPEMRPQMATVRPNVFACDQHSAAKEIKTERLTTSLSSSVLGAMHLLERVKKETALQKLDEANIVISGGYGMESKENFAWIYKVAKLLNAAPGATRKAVDHSWAEEDIQVGQTGQSVAPDLYIACGISGALQHTMGMKRAKKIIAINRDPAAPIFAMADVAILGNATDVLKELYQSLAKQSDKTK